MASRKARSAKEALSEGCFSLNPVFGAALVRMRTVGAAPYVMAACVTATCGSCAALNAS